MTAPEKRRFIRELVSRTREELLKKVSMVPEEWNGIELRTFVADVFKREDCRRIMSRARVHDYNNVMLVRNL